MRDIYDILNTTPRPSPMQVRTIRSEAYELGVSIDDLTAAALLCAHDCDLLATVRAMRGEKDAPEF